MARKRTEKQEMPAIAEEPKLRAVRLELPPELHRLLRLLAADEETSMAAYAREALERHLREEAARRGIKP